MNFAAPPDRSYTYPLIRWTLESDANDEASRHLIMETLELTEANNEASPKGMASA